METLAGRVVAAIKGGGFAGRGVRALALVAAVAAAPASTAIAQPPTPELTKPVNDFAGVIDPQHEAEIERLILALKQATAAKEGRDGSWSSPYGDVVAVATIETFAPYADIREYAVRLFENRGRGIGEKGKDNGLLVIVAIKDRRAQVEVGYDLEPFVPDGFAGDVSRGMTPFFARGQYGAGLLDGVTRIIGRVAQGRGVAVTGVPVAAPEPTRSVRFSPWLLLAIIILIILMNSSGGGRRSRMRRGRTHWGAGSWSGWNSGVGPFGGGGGGASW